MKRVTKYRLVVWCRDCGNGEDPMGCFDGGTSTEDFDTREEAEVAGHKECDGPPWNFRVDKVRIAESARR